MWFVSGMLRPVMCTVFTPLPVACTTLANVCTRNLRKKPLSNSLVTIYELSIDDRAIGDLSIERLAIECLPFTSANVMTKMTRVTVSPSSGSATPTDVGGLGPLCVCCQVFISFWR